ncbi:MAG: hypothetical protein CML17_06140 [Pusillimonas sp.]|jgi:hypothetical protein|nr:hypothetical protein [Pusillimonas sp.]
MEDARTYLKETAPAVEGLFKLLNQYGWQKMGALVTLLNSKTRGALEVNKQTFSSNDIAREVIAGSILQIAYVAIASHAKFGGKSEKTLHFESEINRLTSENLKRARKKDKFELPMTFCVGRHIGHLPLGIIVFAGRNQYNHFYEKKRLSVINELVFNHLHIMWPDPGNGLSFDLKPGKLFSYSILAALGWLDTSDDRGYEAYKRDISDILQI